MNIPIIREIKAALSFYRHSKEREAGISALYGQLIDRNILEIERLRGGNDTWGIGIGTAGRYITKYGLTVGCGTCYNDVRVDLPKDKWHHPLNGNIPTGHYGTWYDMNWEEVQSIYGYGSTLNEAVYKCLLNARTAGVI